MRVFVRGGIIQFELSYCIGPKRHPKKRICILLWIRKLRINEKVMGSRSPYPKMRQRERIWVLRHSIVSYSTSAAVRHWVYVSVWAWMYSYASGKYGAKISTELRARLYLQKYCMYNTELENNIPFRSGGSVFWPGVSTHNLWWCARCSVMLHCVLRMYFRYS